jgi:hypothetical protein
LIGVCERESDTADSRSTNLGGSRARDTTGSRTGAEQLESDVVGQVAETAIHLEFRSVNERTGIRFRLFHQEVGDRDELIIFDHVHEERNQRRCRLLALSVRERVRASLWVAVFQRNWNIFTRNRLLSLGFLS